jgi:hypothetical protein
VGSAQRDCSRSASRDAMGVTPGALLERAQVQSGLSDFGPDGWQGGFERLVAAMGTDVGDNADVTR